MKNKKLWSTFTPGAGAWQGKKYCKFCLEGGGGYLHQQTKNVRRKEENLGKLTRKIKVPLVLGNPNDLPVVWQHYRSFISRWRNKIPRAQCPWALQNWVKRTVFSVITANVTYKRDSVLQRTHEQCRYKSHDQPINPPDIIGSSSVTGNSEFQNTIHNSTGCFVTAKGITIIIHINKQ